ncbi:cobalt/nickel transport system ATP-binding protein [Anaerosolibacter carboniphilus]|uniref:Cobalt/nickel transport system ATP-binding protein n=1 Tax=Anaerosolibacter carboniphilus TaxID=1417629 RepID=A0A841KMZ0_9FIRM|nr:ABC transporter ATP-binding protein [Anaerosolibacter carboniphilus]MBB6215174.1 cobalt/nickel transport system ATP-binding protein [Anaerosolibacter carboniphilus]
MSHHKIEFSDVKYKYPDGRQALKGIDFEITHGESVGIVGANGAGKSTLLMHLTGILFPNEGEIRVGEMPVTKKTLPFIRQKVGMVFQNPDDQLFMTQVYDDVAFGPRNYKLSEEEVSKRVMKSLEIVGITHLKDRPPYKLSGGEKRSVAIAAVLAMEPDILIMDEPSAALDPKARRRLIHLLKQFTHTKLIATHDMDMVLELCDRIIVLKDGRVLADGPTMDILSNEDLMEESNLEIPLVLQNCPVCNGKKSNYLSPLGAQV